MAPSTVMYFELARHRSRPSAIRSPMTLKYRASAELGLLTQSAPYLAAKNQRPLQSRSPDSTRTPSRDLKRPSADQVEFDQRVIGKAGDADAGAGRQAVGREIAAIGRVHGWVGLLEARQIDPRPITMCSKPRSSPAR